MDRGNVTMDREDIVMVGEVGNLPWSKCVMNCVMSLMTLGFCEYDERKLHEI